MAQKTRWYSKQVTVLNMNRKNKLIIFDFDGVLVDTEYTTFDYYRKVLPSYGIYLKEEDFKYKIGRKSIDFFKDVLKDKFDLEFVESLTNQKREAFAQDVKKYLKPIEGAFELLEACKKKGLQMAIGSQNEKPVIQKALDEFNIRKYFQITTSLQDLKNKKPHPEAFLMVANYVRVLPSESVVIEDAPVGILAAKLGGFKSIGITSSFSKEELKGADLIINSMKQLNPELLLKFKAEVQ